MKRIPLLLLLLMVALFAYTLHRPEAWAGWLHAFAEAGMVGALADWFAVVALFRHPLGIPIPHTAIIPNRKDELGEAMARFVSEHFLDPEAVRGKLATINLAQHSIAWLQSAKGQAQLLNLTDTAIHWALDTLDERRVRRFLSRLSRRQLEDLNLAPLAGHTLDWMVRGDRHQEILTQVLRRAIVMLHDHREDIRERVQEESPWWIPGFVDDKILQKMLERIEARLFEISLDPDHPMRGQFTGYLRRQAHELKTSPDHRALGERLKRQLLENQELQDYLYGLWVDLSERLKSDLDSPESATRAWIAGWLDRVSGELSEDADIQAWINEWLTGAVVAVVDGNRSQIASLISDTVKTWDGRETSRRVELALGRDLQFIRINGTLVGGLVGLVIHAVAGG
jgi:uncharacterized membrane-anchored protein YjiN (DUF445 family)